MAIYIDPLRDYRAIMGRGAPGLWCHMITDGSLSELHWFAAQLGIPREYFQDHPRHPHYDLRPSSRALAVALGAVEVSTAELRQRLRYLDETAQNPKPAVGEDGGADQSRQGHRPDITEDGHMEHPAD